MLIEQDIFGFDVPVGDTLGLEVLDGANQLFKKGSTKFRLEPSILGQEIEEFTSRSILKDDDRSEFFLLALKFDFGLSLTLNNIDEMLVFEFG